MLTKLAAASVLLLALAACSGDNDSPDGDEPGASSTSNSAGSGDSTATAKPLPSCKSIWKEGDDLPEDYKGCGKGSASSLTEAVKCKEGKRLVIYGETLYAITGEEIKKTEVSPLQDTDEYSDVYDECKGD